MAFAGLRSSVNASAGARQPSILRGRAFNTRATPFSSLTRYSLKSVPFGKYCCSSPFVFFYTLLPRTPRGTEEDLPAGVNTAQPRRLVAEQQDQPPFRGQVSILSKQVHRRSVGRLARGLRFERPDLQHVRRRADDDWLGMLTADRMVGPVDFSSSNRTTGRLQAGQGGRGPFRQNAHLRNGWPPAAPGQHGGVLVLAQPTVLSTARTKRRHQGIANQISLRRRNQGVKGAL